MGLEVRERYFGSRELASWVLLSFPGAFASSPGGIRWVGTGHSWTEERQGTLHRLTCFLGFLTFSVGAAKGQDQQMCQEKVWG